MCLRLKEQDLPAETEDSGHSLIGTAT